MFGIILCFLCVQAPQSKDLASVYAEYIKYSDKLINAYSKNVYAHEILKKE